MHGGISHPYKGHVLSYANIRRRLLLYFIYEVGHINHSHFWTLTKKDIIKYPISKKFNSQPLQSNVLQQKREKANIPILPQIFPSPIYIYAPMLHIFITSKQSFLYIQITTHFWKVTYIESIFDLQYQWRE